MRHKLWSGLRRGTVFVVFVLFSWGGFEKVSATPGVQRDLTITRWPVREKRFALIIGIDEYQDTQINRLQGAANDAKTLRDALVEHAGFPADQVVLLTSDQPQERWPTRGNILRRLSNLRGTVPTDGLLLVAFAGHGIDRGGRAYLLPSDTQLVGDITLLEDTAINVENLRQRIKDTNVTQVIVIIDACRNDPEGGRGTGDNLLTAAFTRGFSFENINQQISAFATLYATEVGSRAYEYNEKHQGYFTWALVEGLNGAAANDKGEVTLGSLVTYVQDTVPKRVRLDLGEDKKQRPFAVIEGYRANELVIATSTVKNAKSDVLRPGQEFNLEQEQKSSGDILWAVSKGTRHFLIPIRGSKLRIIGAVNFDNVDLDSLRKGFLETKEFVSQAELKPGIVLAVQTRSGSIAKIKVDSLDNDLRFSWVTYK